MLIMRSILLLSTLISLCTSFSPSFLYKSMSNRGLMSEKVSEFKDKNMPDSRSPNEKEKRVVMKFGGSSLADASRVSIS